jgi:hypothetical protein
VFGLLTPAMLGLGARARATTISFSDATFADPNWGLTTRYAQNGGSASAQQITSGGNPGAYRLVNINVAAGNSTAVFAFSLDNNAVYTPRTQGAITLFTYGEDRNTAGAGQEFGPAALQDGTYYYAYAGSGPTTGWQSTSASFASTDFQTPASSTAQPNFSLTGDPITFGFVSINNTNNSAFNSTAGYDNWSVTLTTPGLLPEPTQLTTLAIATIALCRRIRRRT